MVVLQGSGGSKVHPKVACQTMEGLVMQLKTFCLRRLHLLVRQKEKERILLVSPYSSLFGNLRWATCVQKLCAQGVILDHCSRYRITGGCVSVRAARGWVEIIAGSSRVARWHAGARVCWAHQSIAYCRGQLNSVELCICRAARWPGRGCQSPKQRHCHC